MSQQQPTGKDGTQPLLAVYATESPIPEEQRSAKKMKCWRRRKCVFAALSVTALAALLVLYVIRTVPEFNQYSYVRSYDAEDVTRRAQEPRTILLWNDFFGDPRWSLPNNTLGSDYLRDELHCPEYRCELTNDRDFLPALHMYDAVVFHAAQPFSLLQPVPPQRSAQQLYVFALMEPPGETKHVLSDERYFYNLTMTYRLDSDIVWPYKYLADSTDGRLVAPAKYPEWKVPPVQWNDTEVWSLWHGKNRTAAWFVSRCKTLSQREKLVAELQQYIDVDIYGKCGPLKCTRLAKECDDILDQQYKFYLSFENSLCTDYVTEKLYNALKRQLVPVVLGGADYTRFLPPQSYINAEDFDSVSDLALYLEYLSTHPEDYMRYFWWRRYYHLAERSPFCDLCEQLRNGGYPLKMQTYADIDRWWIGGSCRFKAQIDF